MASNIQIAGRSRLGYSVLAFLISVLVAPGGAIALDQVELDLNRGLWNSHNITDYDFILGRSCFCDPVSTRPGLVMVRMDSIASVIDPVTLEPRDPQNFFTIDGAFDLMQQSLNSPDTVVTAEFDPQFGYPHMFGFDIPQLADDEIIYDISAFRVVPEPTSLFLGFIALATLTARRFPNR